jgi:hypothetical protein
LAKIAVFQLQTGATPINSIATAWYIAAIVVASAVAIPVTIGNGEKNEKD